MSRFSLLSTISLFALLTGCASAGTKPDDMSAAEHREAAETERAQAAKHEKKYDPNARGHRPVNPSNLRHGAVPAEFGDVYWDEDSYNPTAGHDGVAAKHLKLASEHEAAAKSLESFEEAECKEFPAATRKVCPLLGTVTSVENIDGGVRLTLADGVPQDAVVAHIKCHFAFAREQGFKGMNACPLYLKTVSVKKDGKSIDLFADGIDLVKALRERAANHTMAR